MMSGRARRHPRDGLTPERPRESNLLGTRVLGLILVLFARVAGSLLGPRSHLACSEANRGAGDASNPLRGGGTVTKPRRVSGNRWPDVECPAPSCNAAADPGP